MARRNASLKPHLNQIRTWVGEGVTDIWIAHQLGSTPASIAAFRRQHGLTRGGAEAAPLAPAVAAAGVATAAPLGDQDAAGDAAEPEASDEHPADDEAAGGDADAPAKRRRRGRRGGRGRGRGKKGQTARVERADGEIVVRIDAAILTGAAAEAWAGAEAATVTVTEAGLQLAPEAPAAD